MTDPSVALVAIWHTIHGVMRATLAAAGVADRTPGASRGTDRGAVSIEHVLWYAAAAISVAVVAAIIWSQVRTTASTPVQSPSAP